VGIHVAINDEPYKEELGQQIDCMPCLRIFSSYVSSESIDTSSGNILVLKVMGAVA
jgi:hypothetical protein